MNAIAGRLMARLVGIQLAMFAIAFVLTGTFTPRVLLLEPEASAASTSVIAVLGLACAGFSTVVTVVRARRLGPLLRALSVGTSAVDPADILALYRIPARHSIANVAFTLLLAVASLFPPFRPQRIDAYTELALVLLVLTMVSTTALPAYVTMRVSVAKVLELAPTVATEDALRNVGRGALGRVRKRFVAAVAAPVAFVALGASLLVDAHARASDREARTNDAIGVARAIFEPIGGVDEAAGHADAMRAASALGYSIYIDDATSAQTEIRHEENETQLTVPVATVPGGEPAVGKSNAVVVRFQTTRLTPALAVYLALAAAAVALAGILGTRIGVAFEGDVRLATREVRRAGVAEVMRGTIILHEARFAKLQELLEAIDTLGGIFREFASAQQRAIDAREANERMRGLLLASMSHDLKAPLNAVLGFAELVGRNELTEAQHESLAIIEQRGRELLVLIDTILDSARVEAGELEVSPEPTHVGDLVMSSVLEARDLAVGTEVQIKGEIQPGMPTLLVDSTRIVQAITAVVLTAVRFSDKGIVFVRATLPDAGDRVRIEVETSGEGLPLAEREKIFDAFKSAQSARRQGGLGLGLQLARSIVEIHAGSIEVDNTDRGGMVFRVWLPVGNDSAAIRARATRALADGATE